MASSPSETIIFGSIFNDFSNRGAIVSKWNRRIFPTHYLENPWKKMPHIWHHCASLERSWPTRNRSSFVNLPHLDTNLTETGQIRVSLTSSSKCIKRYIGKYWIFGHQHEDTWEKVSQICHNGVSSPWWELIILGRTLLIFLICAHFWHNEAR